MPSSSKLYTYIVLPPGSFASLAFVFALTAVGFGIIASESREALGLHAPRRRHHYGACAKGVIVEGVESFPVPSVYQVPFLPRMIRLFVVAVCEKRAEKLVLCEEKKN